MINVAFLCDGHGMETAGKRTPYINSLGRQIRENEFNRAVVKILKTILEHHGVVCYEVAPTDEDTPLNVRTDYANKVFKELQSKHGKNNVNAIYVSIHYDAFDSKFDGNDPEGITVFVYPGNMNLNSGNLAKSVLKYLIQGTPQKNRGVKESNLHVLRETNMPAILTENGFMDNQREALLMINEDFQKEVAMEHAKGICEYFGIEYKEGKEADDMNFHSPTMREKFQMRTASPATKQLLVEKAVKELGYQSTWLDNHNKGLLKDGDYAAIAFELAVYYAKQ